MPKVFQNLHQCKKRHQVCVASGGGVTRHGVGQHRRDQMRPRRVERQACKGNSIV